MLPLTTVPESEDASWQPQPLREEPEEEDDSPEETEV
jgi:hypothetical protein